jgi:hypothetical protein
MLPWDLCTHISSYLKTLGCVSFVLGSMYSTRIYVTALGSVTVHQAMTRTSCHHTCHIDHSDFLSLLSWALYSHACIIIPSLDYTWESLMHLQRWLQVVGVVSDGYVD